MGATKEQAELTRQRLLEAGLKIFSEKGFASTRLEDIAKEAKVTRGAFYWHFKNKLELFGEVFIEALEELHIEMQTLLRSERGPYEKLRSLLIHVPVKFLEDKTFHAVGRLRYKIEWTAEVEEAVMAPLFQTKREAQKEKLLLQLLESGRSSGAFRSDFTAEAMLTMVKVFLSGLIHQVLEPMESYSKDDIQEASANFLKSIAAN